MSNSQIRVRFAPSPTGYLHVGGARTALFNWLFARHNHGVFILRIEDTDRERSSAAMTDAILEGMTWLGLNWDEGPIHQADGFERHRADVTRLVEKGSAYRCFCTVEELERKRAEAKDAYRYDRTCTYIPADESERKAAAGEPHTVRFRVPDGITTWEDAVYGQIEVANADIDDFIILRTDGTPIYNLAVVSDDIDMRITHVIRGDDHVSNTPRQILIYEGLDSPIPTFAHVPMILGSDGKRLSKRHGATAVGEYETSGILPEAMVNFLALLGWSPGEDREIMSISEMISLFSLDRINRKSAIFDKQKLEWMNAQYIARLDPGQLYESVAASLESEGVARRAELDDQRAAVLHLIELLKPRSRYFGDIAAQAAAYFREPVAYDADAVAKHWKNPVEAGERLQAVREALDSAANWDAHSLEASIRALAERSGVALGKLIHPLRVGLLGVQNSPGIFEVLEVLGKARTHTRIDRAIAVLAEQ